MKVNKHLTKQKASLSFCYFLENFKLNSINFPQKISLPFFFFALMFELNFNVFFQFFFIKIP